QSPVTRTAWRYTAWAWARKSSPKASGSPARSRALDDNSTPVPVRPHLHAAVTFVTSFRSCAVRTIRARLVRARTPHRPTVRHIPATAAVLRQFPPCGAPRPDVRLTGTRQVPRPRVTADAPGSGMPAGAGEGGTTMIQKVRVRNSGLRTAVLLAAVT